MIIDAFRRENGKMHLGMNIGAIVPVKHVGA